MVVHQHNRRGTGDNGRSENFTGMNQNGIHCSDADQSMSFDLPARVQQQHSETLAFGIDRRFILLVMVVILNSAFCFASGWLQSPL